MARPASVERAPIEVRGKQKIKESELEARYTDSIKNNKSLQACCRDVGESTVALFKTHEDAKGPDLMIIECDVCHRKQYRAAVGPGRVGA
jgi:hypothetical protein